MSISWIHHVTGYADCLVVLPGGCRFACLAHRAWNKMFSLFWAKMHRSIKDTRFFIFFPEPLSLDPRMSQLFSFAYRRATVISVMVVCRLPAPLEARPSASWRCGPHWWPWAKSSEESPGQTNRRQTHKVWGCL